MSLKREKPSISDNFHPSQTTSNFNGSEGSLGRKDYIITRVPFMHKN